METPVRENFFFGKGYFLTIWYASTEYDDCRIISPRYDLDDDWHTGSSGENRINKNTIRTCGRMCAIADNPKGGLMPGFDRIHKVSDSPANVLYSDAGTRTYRAEPFLESLAGVFQIQV